MKKILAASLFLLLGAGCTGNLPFLSDKELPVAPVEGTDIGVGTGFVIDQTWMGVNVPNKDDYGKKTVKVEEWKPNESGKISWSMREYRETEDSKVARENAAKNVPIGETANIPEPKYEDVVIGGTLTTDSLDNAERIMLPSYWPEGDYDVRGDNNSLLWLSKAQYDELVSTRSSHIQLGLFDTKLQDIINFTTSAKNVLDRLQGKIGSSETTNKDFTKLNADGDFGTYTLMVNGVETKVKTITASNTFAKYVILANPENPLILKTTLRFFALGPLTLLHFSELKALVGYEIISLTQTGPASESQPQR
jgi:hypothetical protein